jgi:hypothetical protein
MKTVIVMCLLAATACSTFAWKDPASSEQMSKIKNFTLCQSDATCDEGQHCGFVCVDCYAVCLDGSHDTAFNSNEYTTLVGRK